MSKKLFFIMLLAILLSAGLIIGCSKTEDDTENPGNGGSTQGDIYTVPSSIDGNSIREIHSGIFPDDFNSENIKHLIIPTNVERINDETFKNWKALEEVTFEAGSLLTYLGGEVFSGCENLASIVLPDSVIEIGDGIFKNCKALTSLYIGKNLGIIGENLLTGTGIAEITVSEDNQYYSSVSGVLFDKTVQWLILYPVKASAASYTVPKSVNFIFSKAFAENLSLQSLDLNNVEVLSEYAFSGCVNINNITGGANLQRTYIGVFEDTLWFKNLSEEYNFLGSALIRYNGNAGSVLDLTRLPAEISVIYGGAFSYNESIIKVLIPKNISAIGSGAFYSLKNLEGIYLLSIDTIVNIDYMALKPTAKIHISKQLENIYKQDRVVQMYGYDKMLDSIKVTLTFDSDGGGYYAPIVVEYGGAISNLPVNPTKQNHIFESWYLNGQKYQNGVLWDKTENSVLIAKWIAA